MTDGYSGADLFVDALERYGVEYVFGNPGTTELPIMNALADSDLEYVLGLHEDVAVGMAAGYAQTRRYHSHHDPTIRPVGVVNLHVTPGVAHGLGNLYDASVTGAPIVVTAGNHSTDFRAREPILSGDLLELTDQFCKWADEVLDVRSLPMMLRRAFRVALTPPTGPVFLGLPLDVMMDSTGDDPQRLGPIPTAGGGDSAQIERAADALVEAQSPVLVVGDHVARAGAVEQAVELAEVSGARVHGEILACEVNFPTGHDQWVSYIPPDETLARTVLAADTVVLAGCSTNTTLTRHEGELIDLETTTIVQLSDDAWEVGKIEPADAAVVGDPGSVMAAIADRLAARLAAPERETRLETVSQFKQMAEARMRELGEDDRPDDPRASKAELVDAMRAAVPDASIVDEGVTSRYAMLTRWPMGAEQYVSNKGGGLGYGLPAALGGALAEAQTDDPRDVVGFVGDGSYLYYPHAMYTAARHDLDIAVVVSDNRNYRILKDNTLSMLGGEEADYDFVGMDFDPFVDIPTNAESHGVEGRLVDDPEAIEDEVSEAVETEGPVVLDVLVHD